MFYSHKKLINRTYSNNQSKPKRTNERTKAKRTNRQCFHSPKPTIRYTATVIFTITRCVS